MDKKELDLRELLKGHEGEYFYHLMYGEVRLATVSQEDVEWPISICLRCNAWFIKKDGKGNAKDSAYLLFPSRELFEKHPLDAIAAWNEWSESNNTKIKTWDDVNVDDDLKLKTTLAYLSKIESYPYVKSATALIKICYLIEKGYGGLPTKAEWESACNKYIPTHHHFFHLTGVEGQPHIQETPIAFRADEYANEFIFHNENVRLLKEFLMIC